MTRRPSRSCTRSTKTCPSAKCASPRTCAAARDELLLLDGPLRKRRHIPDAVGIIKTHHVRYLPPELNRVVGALDADERTPIFRVDAAPFSRASWYVRLPGPPGGPWAGIVRCEASGALAVDTLRDLADRVTVTLGRFASTPHKDARAPQNLYPIGGLERRVAPPSRRRPRALSRAAHPCRRGQWAFRRADTSGRLGANLYERQP